MLALYNMADNNMCYLVVLLVAAALAVYGLAGIVDRRRPNEDGMAQANRQLSGFGWMILAQIVLVFGAALCFSYNGGMQSVRGFLSHVGA